MRYGQVFATYVFWHRVLRTSTALSKLSMGTLSDRWFPDFQRACVNGGTDAVLKAGRQGSQTGTHNCHWHVHRMLAAHIYAASAARPPRLSAPPPPTSSHICPVQTCPEGAEVERVHTHALLMLCRFRHGPQGSARVHSGVRRHPDPSRFAAAVYHGRVAAPCSGACASNAVCRCRADVGEAEQAAGSASRETNTAGPGRRCIGGAVGVGLVQCPL